MSFCYPCLLIVIFYIPILSALTIIITWTAKLKNPHGLNHSLACLCKYGSLPRRQYTAPRGMWSLLKHSALGVKDVWIEIIDVWTNCWWKQISSRNAYLDTGCTTQRNHKYGYRLQRLSDLIDCPVILEHLSVLIRRINTLNGDRF